MATLDQTLTFAGATESLAMAGDTQLGLVLQPTNEAYVVFEASDDNENWTVLPVDLEMPSRQQETGTVLLFSDYVRARFYGGIGNLRVEFVTEP